MAEPMDEKIEDADDCCELAYLAGRRTGRTIGVLLVAGLTMLAIGIYFVVQANL